MRADAMELTTKRFEELTIDELYDILKVRSDVFVVEQNCPYPDADGRDRQAYHVFLTEKGEIKAYLRVLDRGAAFDDVAIGRVLTVDRGRGLGTVILKAGIAAAREKLRADRIKIEAQTYAVGFYEKQGFRVTSEEFLEDGIPHVQMLWEEGK